jgi:hypothetical protein
MTYRILDSVGNTVAVFVHVPRTGGTFVREILYKYKFRTEIINHCHDSLETALDGVPKDVFSFTFIRHPVTWYPSRFAYCVESKWSDDGPFPELFRHFQAETLRGFVGNVQRLFPAGYLLGLFDRSCRCEKKEASFVGRYETLHSDLYRILLRLGLNTHSTHQSKLVNASVNKVPLDDETANLIRWFERRAIEEWYPWTIDYSNEHSNSSHQTGG